MGSEGNRLVKAGYSSDVINRLHLARRPSTNQVYASKWAAFERFCQERGDEASSSSPGTIAAFLHHLDVDKHLAPATIKAYRAAIGHMTRLATGFNPGDDQVCSLLVKSIERAHPPAAKRVPNWDVSIVLRALLQPNLADEHLSRHLLTAKTTFLLALATGERRSGLHALSHDVLFEDTSPTVMHLHFVADYVPKSWYIRKNKVGVEPIRIPCIGEKPYEPLCPVHTTLRYLTLVKEERTPSQTSLLIPHAAGASKNLAVQAVARYIVKLVKWAYHQQNLKAPTDVRGHDTRGLAASLASLSGVSLTDVLASGNWASATTFLRHYYRSFSPDFVQNLIDLPKFVAGKQLISTSSVAELRRQPREEASPAEARKEVPQQSLMQLGTKREEGKENLGGRAKSPPPKSPNPSTAKRTLFLSTPNGEPPRPIQLSQRAYDWLQQRGLVKSRPPVASPDTSSTSA